MDSATLYLLAAGLFIAWIIGPAIVLHYRLAVVPRRYREIRERFISNNPGEARGPEDDRQKSAAWHYARLLDPDSELNPEEFLRNQFQYFHGWNHYLLPLVLVIILSGLMLAFSGLWIAERLWSSALAAEKPTTAAAGGSPTNAPAPSPSNTNAPANPAKPSKDGFDGMNAAPAKDILVRIPVPLVMALWGAYVWSLYEILSRKRSGNLTPVELYEIATRYVSALPVGYAFSLLVFDTVPALAAFSISAFPLRDIRQFFRKYALSKLSEKSPTAMSAVSKGYLGDTLCGMGNDTIARLEELNIETYLDLAYADPIKVLIKTGVPIELVLSWKDQAMLSVYAGPHKAALASYGMSCAIDVYEFYTRHCWDVAKKEPRSWRADTVVTDLAKKLGIPEDFVVEHLLRSVFDDPHTKFLFSVWYGPSTPD